MLLRLFLYLLLLAPAIAQIGGTSYDRLFIPAVDSAYGPINFNTKVVGLRTQTLSSAVRNLVIISAGQSNITNIAPSAYTPTNPNAIDNLNIYDGAIYAAVDPLVGTNINVNYGPGNPILRLADSLIIANKFDRVVIVPTAVNGTKVVDWDTGFASQRIPVAIWRLANRGIVDGMTNVTVIVLWGQGESDNSANTMQAAYTTSLNSVIAKSRTAGFAGLWFVAIQTWDSLDVNAGIQAAQAAVVSHGDNVWGGPIADQLVATNCGGNTCRQADNLHWSDIGSAYYAGSTGSGGWYQALALYGAPF